MLIILFLGLSFFVFLIYIALLLYFIYGYLQIKNYKIQSGANVKISILIPFRNERENLPFIIDCLAKQTIHILDFEIIFINDHSSDESVNIVSDYLKNHKNINVSLLHLSETFGKKNAILKGVDAAQHNWIVTIDADILVEKNWLEDISKFLALETPDLLILPVKIEGGKTFFAQLQQLEFVFLSGITAAATELGNPFLCNGANLSFNKKTFQSVNPFDDNLKIASGDDLFLLQKIKQKANHKIMWLQQKSVIASTLPKIKLSEFISQRIRWSGKTKAIKSPLNTITAVSVFLVSVVTILLLIVPIFQKDLLKFALVLVPLKIGVEVFCFLVFSKFYGTEKNWWMVIILQPIYCFYIIFIGAMSIFATTEWKGRKIKNR